MEKALAAINLPGSWTFYVSTIVAMLALAGLDFIGAIFAKEWAERGRIPMFILGWLSFSVLFIVYARILKVAELSTVTIGWIVFLQVGLLVLDVVHYDVHLPRSKWIAIAVMIALQIYLIAAPNTGATPRPDSAHTPAQPALHAQTTSGEGPSDPQPVPPEPRRPSRPLGPNAA